MASQLPLCSEAESLENLLFLKDVLIEHLQPLDILPDLVQRIPDIQSKMSVILKKMKQQSSAAAIAILLDWLEENPDTGNIKAFYEVLRENDYKSIETLVKNYPKIKENSQIKTRFLGLFNKMLVENVYPSDIIPHLIDVINYKTSDHEEVRNTDNTEKGMLLLLAQLSTMGVVSDCDWLAALLYALKKSGHGELCHIILPETNSEEQFDSFKRRIRHLEIAQNGRIEADDVDSVLLEKYAAQELDKGHFSVEMDEHLNMSLNNLGVENHVETALKVREISDSADSLESNEDNMNFTSKNIQDKNINVLLDNQGPLANIPENQDFVEGFVLRKYQEELARPAIDGENTLIVSPTGSGKTHVAMAIAKNHLEEAAGTEHKILFLVPTVALVEQQFNMFEKHVGTTNVKVCRLCSNDAADVPIDKLVDINDIFIVTPQIIVDALKFRTLESLSVFSLLIFDECHHTMKKHPYCVIMARYLEMKENNQHCPQVVGMTASVGVGKAKGVEGAKQHILALCANLDTETISTVTENKEELLEHVVTANMGIIETKVRPDDPIKDIVVNEIMKEIEGKMLQVPESDCPEINNFARILVPPAQRGSQPYINFISTLEMETVKIYKQDARRILTACTRQLKVYNNALIINHDCRSIDAVEYIEKELANQPRSKYHSEIDTFLQDLHEKYMPDLKKYAQHVENQSSPKLDDLRRILSKELQENFDSRIIIFVRTRFMTEALCKWLDECLPSLRAKPLVGSNAPGTSSGTTKVGQQNVLTYFKEGYHKVLVATSVAEEGLDVQKCNLVIRYEYVTNETAMVQARGRGRASGARYILLTDSLSRREIINKIREEIMEEGLKDIKDLPKSELARKIQDIQRGAKVERQLSDLEEKAKAAIKRAKSRSQPNCILRCPSCDAFACTSKDLRTINHQHHVVVETDEGSGFQDRVDIRSKKGREVTVAAALMTFNGDLLCKRCGSDWGVTALYKKMDFYVLKISSFLLVDGMTEKQFKVKKWKQCPFKVDEISMEDLEVTLQRKLSNMNDL